MAEQTPSLVGQVISGCEILQKTAEGGMGAVYRARHKALNRIVCVKILSPSLSKDKKAIELFLTEARAIAELDHPNIVNVYNVGKENGYYFIVMSFIEGQTLSALLKKNKILPVNQVLDLFDGVLKGLEAAHAKGIIHRDIKPSNILITPEGQAKLVDFGIAKKMDKTGSTKTTELAGTAYFIAPEQALGKNLDTRADLYSIGASLFYVLTGQFPYNGKNTIEIIQKHINNPIPNPVDIRKDLPAWLGPAIQKLMSKNPANRFQTAKETAEFFRKMRAEDQLRLKSGRGGKEIDLGGDASMAVSKEERQTSPTVSRAGMPRISTMPTQPTFNKSLIPQLSPADLNEKPKPAPAAKKAKTSIPFVPAKTPSAIPGLAPLGSNVGQKSGGFFQKVSGSLFQLLVFAPLFALLAAFVVFAFYNMGKLSIDAVSPYATFLQNVTALLTAPFASTTSMVFGGLCLLSLVLAFMASSLPAFARSTTTLLCLAGVSLLAGLFTPDLPFMDLTQASSYLFSAPYHLCYLVLASAWIVSLCFTINRSLPQGILGAVLVVFAVMMTCICSSLSMGPNLQDPFFRVVFYGAGACGLLAVFYFLSRQHKSSVVMPMVLFILSVVGMWMYSVSGVAQAVNQTVSTLASNVSITTAQDKMPSQPTDLQKALDVPSALQAFQKVDKTNEFTYQDLAEVAKEIEPRIEKAAPGVFTPEQTTFFARLLAPYYQGGESRIRAGAWEFALLLPIREFNRQAQQNDAYFFLIALLYIFGLIRCVGTILLGDEQ